MQRIYWNSSQLSPTQRAILENIKRNAWNEENKKDQECKELLGFTNNNQQQPHGYYIKLLCKKRMLKNYQPQKNDTEEDIERREKNLQTILNEAESWILDNKDSFFDDQAYNALLDEIKKYKGKGDSFIKQVEGLKIQEQGSLVMLGKMVADIIPKLEKNNPDYLYTSTERFTEGSKEEHYFADFYEEVKKFKKGAKITDPDWRTVVYTGAYEFKKNLYVWHIGKLSYEELKNNIGLDSFKQLADTLATDFDAYIRGVKNSGSAVKEIDEWIQKIMINISIELIEWKFSHYYPVFLSDKDVLLCSEVIANILGDPEQNLPPKDMTTLYTIEDLIQLYAIDGIPTYNPITDEVGDALAKAFGKEETIKWYKEHYIFSPKFKASAWYGHYTGNAWEE